MGSTIEYEGIHLSAIAARPNTKIEWQHNQPGSGETVQFQTGRQLGQRRHKSRLIRRRIRPGPPLLETSHQSFPASATQVDSIFVYKYHRVIYVANPTTRQKGEKCMVQLIKMKPAIELIDIYISDNIAAIFKDVKTNYFQQQKYIREHDIVGNESTDSLLPVSWIRSHLLRQVCLPVRPSLPVPSHGNRPPANLGIIQLN